MRNQTRYGSTFDDPHLALLAIVVGLLNVFILLILLGIYISSYRKIKSNFTLGLIFFTLLLILQNMIFITFLMIKAAFRGPGMGLPVLTINLSQLGALLVLLKISWE